MDEEDGQIEEDFRDDLIELLAQTGPAKILPDFVPAPLAGAAKKYSIVKYFVELNELLQIAYGLDSTPEELLTLAKNTQEGEREVLEAIIENPNVTEEILKFIAVHHDDSRGRAISHPKFPIEVLEEMANSEHEEVRFDAVTTGKLSPETLTRLSTDKYWRVRWKVAKDEKTPPEALASLVSDEKYEGVADSLLGNKSLPSELFEPILKRAQEEDAKGAVKPYKTKPADGGEWRAPPAELYWRARVAAASNPRAPEELLRAIATESTGERGWHARSEVARNPSTPIDLVQALAKDEIAHVRNPAKRALQTREWRGPEEFKSIRENFKRFLK